MLGCSRTDLYRDQGAELTGDQREALDRLVAARQRGEPLQYLTGVQAFGSIELSVGPGVLVPRPETELLAERAVAVLREVPDPVVVDVGTGSGAIAFYVATKRPDARIWATDNSADALGWARRNRKKLGVKNVRIMECNLFSGVPPELQEACDLVVSNPPYLSEAEHAAAAPDVREHEPAAALVSGDEGLELSLRLVEEAARWLRHGGRLLLETGPEQAQRLQLAMEEHFQGVTITNDLTGRPRLAEGSKP